MKIFSIRYFTLIFLILFLCGCKKSITIPYCPGTQANSLEDKVIQKLVNQFAQQMQCEVGNNCLLKWNIANDTEKFSIAWKKQCGPVINGVYQLGDEGHGSTFVCKYKNNRQSVCCWPLGYDYVRSFVVCSD